MLIEDPDKKKLMKKVQRLGETCEAQASGLLFV